MAEVMHLQGIEDKLHTVPVVVYKQYIGHIVSQDFTSSHGILLQWARPFIFLLFRAPLHNLL